MVGNFQRQISNSENTQKDTVTWYSAKVNINRYAGRFMTTVDTTTLPNGYS